MKKKILFGIGVVFLIVICFSVFLLSGAGSTYYYSQIDNNKSQYKVRDWLENRQNYTVLQVYMMHYSI